MEIAWHNYKSTNTWWIIFKSTGKLVWDPMPYYNLLKTQKWLETEPLKWLRSNTIHVFEWPSQSPDLYLL